MSFDDLLTKANAALDNFDYRSAKEFFEQHLASSTDIQNRSSDSSQLDPQILSAYANVLLELGDTDKAKNILLQTTKILQSEKITDATTAALVEVLLNLGQLTVGAESLEYFLKGASLLENEIQQLTTGDSNNVDKIKISALKKHLSSVFCSCAELYMSDLCFEASAESFCDGYIQRAFAAALTPEAYQLQANLFICQNRTEDAIISARKSLDMWLNLPQDTADGLCSSALPSYEQRVACSKLLIELQLFDDAFEVLSRVQKENDEDVEIWYLFGWTYYLVKDYTASKECLQMGQQLYYKNGFGDLELIAHLEELLEELNAMMIEESDQGGSDGNADEDAEIEIE